MSDFLKLAVLAVTQGIAEFLPVSSSGHLALCQRGLGMEHTGVTLSLFLHAGTLVSVLIFFRRRIAELIKGVFAGERGALFYMLFILLSMIPAGLAYALFADSIERIYSDPSQMPIFFIFTGGILFSFRFWDHGMRENKPASAMRAFLMGVAQAFALIPGISRSGSTIFTARLLGMARDKAVEFSLFMSVPVVGGALFVDLLKYKTSGGAALPQLAGYSAAALISCVVGYFAIPLLIGALKRGLFWVFGVYCMILGAVTYILS